MSWILSKTLDRNVIAFRIVICSMDHTKRLDALAGSSRKVSAEVPELSQEDTKADENAQI